MDGVERNTAVDSVLIPAPANTPAATSAGNSTAPANASGPNFSANLQNALQQNPPVSPPANKANSAASAQNPVPTSNDTPVAVQTVQDVVAAIVNAIEDSINSATEAQPANGTAESTQSPAEQSPATVAPAVPQLIITIAAENLPDVPATPPQTATGATSPVADNSTPKSQDPAAVAVHLLEALAASLAATTIVPARAAQSEDTPAADSSTGTGQPPAGLVITLTRPTLQIAAVISAATPEKPAPTATEDHSEKSDDQSLQIQVLQIALPVTPNTPAPDPFASESTASTPKPDPASTKTDEISSLLVVDPTPAPLIHALRSSPHKAQGTSEKLASADSNTVAPSFGEDPGTRITAASTTQTQDNSASGSSAQSAAATPAPAVAAISHHEDFGVVSPRDPQKLIDRIADAVLHSHDTGRELSVRISPPDLGPVRIEVHSDAGVITARVETQSSAAQQVLSDHLPQLHDALAQRGSVIERIDVVRSDSQDVRSHAGGEANWSAAGQQSQQNSQDSPRRRSPPVVRGRKEPAIAAATLRPDLGLQELNVRV